MTFYLQPYKNTEVQTFIDLLLMIISPHKERIYDL